MNARSTTLNEPKAEHELHITKIIHHHTILNEHFYSNDIENRYVPEYKHLICMLWK